MLKSIKNLGESLTKEQQREVKGGFNLPRTCRTNRDCLAGSPFLFPGDVSCRFSFLFGSKTCVFN